MSKPLKAWLLRRRQEAPTDSVYVFWKLVCLKEDRGKPNFNQTLDPEDRANSISSNVSKLWREFLHRAGVPVDLMTLLEGDILDLKGFIEKVRSKAGPNYEWFFSRCKKNCQKVLQKVPVTEKEFKELEKLLRRNLNLIIEGDFAYDENVFGNVDLRGQTREVLNPEYKGGTLIYFSPAVFGGPFSRAKTRYIQQL